LIISRVIDYSTLGFLFQEVQLQRAIREGVLSILNDPLRNALSAAYGAISRANEFSRNYVNLHHTTVRGSVTSPHILEAVKNAVPLIQKARDLLLQFVRSDD